MPTPFKVQTLNNIAVAGLERFPLDRYEVASELATPDALMVRSANLHDVEIPPSVLAIGRAGAGVTVTVERSEREPAVRGDWRGLAVGQLERRNVGRWRAGRLRDGCGRVR